MPRKRTPVTSQIELQEVVDSFPTFLLLCWKQLNLPKPTKVQYNIARFLSTGPRRRGIQGYRGVGKSWITAAYCLWRLLKNADEHILVISASKQRADDFSSFCLRLLNEMPILHHLRPREGQRCSMLAFDVGPATISQSPSLTSRGINSQVTGNRASIIIFDDVEVPNNSATFEAREKLKGRMAEAEAIITPGGEIIVLGTFQSSESIYIGLIDGGIYQFRFYPVRYPRAEDIIPVYRGMLDPDIEKAVRETPEIAGKPTDPARFDDAELVGREASYGKSEFTRQFMLNTRLTDLDKFPLKLQDLIVHPYHPTKAPVEFAWGTTQCVENLPGIGLAGDRFYRPIFVDSLWQPYTGRLLTIDPSGRGKDETAWNVTYNLGPYIFLAAQGGFRDGYSDQVLSSLAKIAADHGVHRVIVEANFGDGMFTQLLKPHFRGIKDVTIAEVKHSTQKEARIIDTLEPILNQHRLVTSEEIITSDVLPLLQTEREDDISYSLFYQLSRLTRTKGALRHDDRLDALAMAVAYWTSQMAQKASENSERIKQDMLLEEVEGMVRGLSMRLL